MKTKKSKLKYLFMSLSIKILIIFAAFVFTCGYFYRKYDLDTNKLTSLNNGVRVSSTLTDNSLYNSTRSIVSIEDLPNYVPLAFVDAEDKRFYSHNGYDLKRIVKASFVNLSNKSKSQGASTISQQLIKNALLTNEKTYSRKIQEVVLAIKMEKKFEKDEILEMYLNTIYFGSKAYGIENASNYYFNKSAKDLTLNEACCLAGIIKSPVRYSPKSNMENAVKRKNIIAKLMLENGHISNEDYLSVINSSITLSPNNSVDLAYEEEAIHEACSLLNISERELINKNYEIITFKNQNLQNEVAKANKKVLNDAKDSTKSSLDALSIVSDNNGHILAYYANSNYDLHNIRRQPASTLKPLAVYLPCVKHNILSSVSRIVDEEINYNGYSPSNADNSFHGSVSVRESVAQSLNIPAVKALDLLGTKRAKETLLDFGINISNSDFNLSLALGAVKNGVKLTDLLSAYLTLATLGVSKPLTFIDKILDADGNAIYSHETIETKVVESASAFILTDMLKDTTKYGTAKRLNSLNIPIASKTGTASIDQGNTDLYNISYTTEHTMLTWVANIKDKLLPSALHSSTQPTQINKDICAWLYKDHKPQDFIRPSDVQYLPYNTAELEENNKLVAPTSDTLERYVAYDYFKTNNKPQIQDETKIPFSVVLDDFGARIKFDSLKHKTYRIMKETNGEKELLKTIENEANLVDLYDHSVFNNHNVKYFIENQHGTIISELKHLRPKDYLINKLNNEVLTNKKRWYV